MRPEDKAIEVVKGDRRLMEDLYRHVEHMLRPIRQSGPHLDFDYGRTTRFEIPDSLPQRAEALVEIFVHEILRRIMPEVREEARSEARQLFINNLKGL